MLRTFLLISKPPISCRCPSLRRYDEGRLGGLHPFGKLLWPSPPRSFDPVAGSPLVHALSAVDPFQPGAARAHPEESRQPVLGRGLMLVLHRSAVDGVRVGRLLVHRPVDGPLSGADLRVA